MNDDIFIWGQFVWKDSKLHFHSVSGPENVAMLRVHELKQPVANDEH